MRAALAGLLLLALAPANADEIQIPAALDRNGPAVAIWHPSAPAAGVLDLDWTDAAGRLVERHRLTLDQPLPEVAVTLDLRRAVLPDNRLTARFTPRDGGAASVSQSGFVARPPPGWDRYQVLMWQDLPPAGLAGLAALGITGAKLMHPLAADGRVATAQRLAAGVRWYDENLATDFYAAYHRWRPGLSVTWAMDRLRDRHRAAPDDISVFSRSPSLSDPAWLATISARLTALAREQAAYRPLFYNLGDESGIADLAAAWDFDRSPGSLSAMRLWLRGRFASLAALNRAWNTSFADWDAVTPALTDAALRDDGAVPSWMAFKAWMDTAFARAVRAGADAIHRGDPEGLAALEGGQIPGWGGYDYAKLAPALDAMEIYDFGNAVEIAQSVNPALRVLTTSFESGPAEQRRLWHEFLLGGHGTIIWDETGEVVRPDGAPGPRGEALAPVFRALSGAIGAQLLDAAPARGEAAILYSQASFRLEWLLARRSEGADWTLRSASSEYADTPWRAATRRAARLLAELGAQPRWVTPEQLAGGLLARDGTRLLVLPHSIALSDAEVTAVRHFAEAGGTVLADIPPGERDDLGRRRAALPLADLAASGRLLLPAWLRQAGAPPDEMATLLAQAGVHPPLAVVEADGRPAAGVDIRLFRSGAALIAGIQRQDSLTGERTVALRLPAPLWVRQAGGAAPDRPVTSLTLQLGPVMPALLVLSPAPLPALTLTAPAQAATGDLVPIRLGLDGPSQLAARFVRLEVIDPAAQPVPALSATIRVPPQGCVWNWPLAVSDRPGAWEVRATDALTGQVVSGNVLTQAR